MKYKKSQNGAASNLGMAEGIARNSQILPSSGFVVNEIYNEEKLIS